eukprot:359993-Chlamydomonas_euryale.AAC.6
MAIIARGVAECRARVQAEGTAEQRRRAKPVPPPLAPTRRAAAHSTSPTCPRSAAMRSRPRPPEAAARRQGSGRNTRAGAQCLCKHPQPVHDEGRAAGNGTYGCAQRRAPQTPQTMGRV